MVYNPPQGWDQPSPPASPSDPQPAPVTAGQSGWRAPWQDPPASWPVAVYTALFGVFGAIAASRRAAKARALGASTSPYWVAFAVVMSLNAFVSIGMVVSVAIPVYLSARESAETKVVESRLLNDVRAGAAAAGAPEPTSVDCHGDGPFVDGFRAYHCVAYFADGGEERATLLADRDGNWKPPTS